jgi:tetratricopeptide (TPR) repeat protein
MKKILHFALAVLFIGNAAWAQQQKVSGFLLTTSSNEAKSSFSEGLKFNDLGETKKAREAFQKAIEQDPNLAIGYLYKANLATTPQEFTSNLNKAKENLANATEWEKLFYDFTETFLTDDLNKRLATAQTMATKYPDIARAHVLLGEAYSARNDFARARQSYQKAISVEPSWPGGYILLSNSYLFEEPRDFKMAEKNATKLTQLASASSGAFILLGDTYRAQNELQKAHDAYSKAVQLDPESPSALYKRGHALTYLGQYEKARADYQQAGSLDVMPTFATDMIAFTYLYQDQPAKALQVLMDEAGKTSQMTDASKATASKYDMLSNAAQIAFHINDAQKLQTIVEAIGPLSEEIGNSMGANEAKLNQKSTMLYWKGVVNAMNKDFMNAMAKAEEMKTTLEPIQNPRKLEGYESLVGYINYQQKDYKGAIDHFEKTNMQDMYNKYWLAKAYEAAGKKDKATALYKEIANYNFNNIGYALVRNEVKKKI